MGHEIIRKVPFGDLPTVIKDKLAEIGYSRSTGGPVSLVARRVTTTNGIADDGERAVCVEITDVEPDAGQPIVATTEWGSFGGPSPYEKRSIDVERSREIKPRGAIIDGSTSNRKSTPSVRVFVRPYLFAVIVHKLPDAFLPADGQFLSVCADAFAEDRFDEADRVAEEALLAAEAAIPDPLTVDERKVMYAYGCIKSGPYRKDEIDRTFDAIPYQHRMAHVDSLISSLIVKGFLRRNGAGAISMTVAGKNTRIMRGGSSSW